MGRKTRSRSTRPRDHEEVFNPHNLRDVMGREHDLISAGRRTWRVWPGQ